MARDITVKALSKNLLQKYGLGKKVSEEEEEGGAQSSGSGAKPKGKGSVGRKAMTASKKDMIKGGSFIALGHQGTL